MAQNTPIEQQGLGPGAKAAQGAGTQAKNMAGLLNVAKARGGALLKILNDLAGPLAIASGFAAGFAGKMLMGVRNTERVQRGLEKIASINVYSPQFAKLLGGLAMANKRLEMLWRWKTKSIFSFDDAAGANKTLQILTGGLLATGKGMDLIADLAAAGGTSLSQMADVVGSLYDKLANGQPIDAEVQTLRQLGVVSTDAANRITLLTQSGAGFADVWGAVHGELRKSSGSMKTLAGEIAGLQKRLENAQADQDKSIGEQFAEGEKAGLEASIAAAEALTPIYRNVAVVLGGVWTGFQKTRAAVVEFLTIVPGLKGALTGVILGFIALIGLLGVFSVASTVGGIVFLIRALGGWAVAAASAAGATTLLGRSLTALGWLLPRLLGPWGLIITAVSALAGLFADAAISAHTFGKAQEDLKKQVDDTNQSIQEQVKNIKTQGDKSTALGAAGTAVSEAEDNLHAAKEEQRKNAQDWNPFNDEGRDEAVAKREEELKRAKETLETVKNAPTDAAVESLLGPDYAAAKKDSEERQAGLEKERQKLDLQRQAVEALERAKRGNGFMASGTEIEAAQARVNAVGANGKSSVKIAEEQKALAARQAREATEFSPDNINRRFEIRQTLGDTRVRAMRELFKRTGDLDLRDKADATEDQLFQERRKKDLIDKGYNAESAEKQASADTVINASERERERAGRPQVSSLAAIGGASGFAGVTSDVPKQQLDRLREIEKQMKELNVQVKRGGDAADDSKF